MATRNLYLIRHGQHRRNEDDPSAEHLTPVGVEQAQRTAQRLAVLPVTAIHHSSILRAAETAHILARALAGVPTHSTLLLHECLPCLPPNAPIGLSGWQWGPWGELLTLPEMPDEWLAHGRAQAEGAFERYFHPAQGEDEHLVLVTHALLTRYLVCRALGAPPEAWVNVGTANCGITWVRIRSDGAMLLVSLNDVGHLPEHLRTYA